MLLLRLPGAITNLVVVVVVSYCVVIVFILDRDNVNELVVVVITVVLFVVVRPELDNSVSDVLKVDVVLFVFSMS